MPSRCDFPAGTEFAETRRKVVEGLMPCIYSLRRFGGHSFQHLVNSSASAVTRRTVQLDRAEKRVRLLIEQDYVPQHNTEGPLEATMHLAVAPD